jgi:hypothetical protein
MDEDEEIRMLGVGTAMEKINDIKNQQEMIKYS